MDITCKVNAVSGVAMDYITVSEVSPDCEFGRSIAATIQQDQRTVNMISSRWKTRLVSVICVLLILPWSLFFGVMFTFSFRSPESAWAWIFDFVTYWNQLLAAVFSFVRPRTAAFWMLADIACSAAIGLGFILQFSSASGGKHGTWLNLIQDGNRRLNVHYARFDGPWPITIDVLSFIHANTQILVPGHQLIGVGSLVKQSAFHGNSIGSQHIASEADHLGTTGQLCDGRHQIEQISDRVHSGAFPYRIIPTGQGKRLNQMLDFPLVENIGDHSKSVLIEIRL